MYYIYIIWKLAQFYFVQKLLLQYASPTGKFGQACFGSLRSMQRASAL
jgi:hypothetical protein